MNKPLVELVDIGKVFVTPKVETHALADVSFTINPEEFVLVSGASGCGKSTLLSLIGLLERPSSGTYRFRSEDTAGFSVTKCAHTRNREFGFVFQGFHLIHDLSIRENTGLPLRYRKEFKPADVDQKVEVVLDRVGIAHRAEHYPSQLSGGQQQRAAIARALIGEPGMILADEPTGNLDAASSENVFNLLAELNNQGTTVCVVSHDPSYRELSNKTIELEEGRISAVVQ